MRAYLDSNISIYLENGDFILTDLIKKIDSRIDKIYFSSAHLKEADEIRDITETQRNERIFKRAKTIETVTQSNYLYQDLEIIRLEHKSSHPQVRNEMLTTNAILRKYYNYRDTCNRSKCEN